MPFPHPNSTNVDPAQHLLDSPQIVSALQAIEAEVRAVCFSGEIRDVETALELSNTASRTVHLALATPPDIESIQTHLNLIEGVLRRFPTQVKLREQIQQTAAMIQRFA